MTSATEFRVIGWRESLATRATFLISGLGMATWAPLVPFVQSRLGLNSGSLGLLILCLGTGAILSMPFAGMLTAQYGCRLVILLSCTFQCLSLPILAVAPGVPAVVFALLMFGGAMGMLECAMNIQGIIVERAIGRTMMPGFHGLFSVGGIAGAAGVSGLHLL